MNQVTKAQAEALIERLANKTTQGLCSAHQTPNLYCYLHICYKPVMLTDVLEKGEVVLCWEEEERKDRIYDLWCLWYECGVTKSLQTILQEAEWEDIGHHTHNMRDCRQCANKPMIGSAADLFRFLSSLFPET